MSTDHAPIREGLGEPVLGRALLGEGDGDGDCGAADGLGEGDSETIATGGAGGIRAALGVAGAGGRTSVVMSIDARMPMPTPVGTHGIQWPAWGKILVIAASA
ncbi:hypothetical protein Val02_36250 [Virgisporangium aliadipatigenens]|uniref:Uncharacterized protein n=1 Tax=Virgisporangium aliadipatigenens TaxID=741659 RepID=A0A8J3YJU8_9ACTN|nr:hypothetical protein [Virgisporangium aliadipatigenens]GIJ46739.1 hypothetical protein Val02_36250 [Virgisporangium aliadipatigenens]